VADALGKETHPAEPIKKGARVTGAERAQMAADLVNRYAAGESIRALALATGRSYGFIHRILTEHGVTLRGRGGATRAARRPTGDPVRRESE
jgi:hypothetical protein